MKRALVFGCTILVGLLASPRTASADWLLTGFIGPVTNVKTSEKTENGRTFPAETFDNSTGFGVNLASAFPAAGGTGFELDAGFLNKGMQTSDRFGTRFASKLTTISTNFFISPAVPRVRPYFAVGPNFTNRTSLDTATVTVPSSWSIGFDAGGGVIAFVDEHVGGRFDVRYYRNIGDFVDLKNVTAGGQLWNNLQYIRIFFGGTVVLR